MNDQPNPPRNKTTILIADNHTLVRETWSYLLNTHPGLTVVGEAGSGEEAIALAKVLRPHVVIMDINLPGINGIEATGQVRRYSPTSKVLGVSLHTQPTYARQMMQQGADGYVTKNSPRAEMIRAIAEIQKGGKYICQEIKDILSEQMLSGEAADGGINSQTAREIEIIARIKSGGSSKEIAEALSISVKTVEVHRYNILRKLKLKNTAALINFINQSRLELE